MQHHECWGLPKPRSVKKEVFQSFAMTLSELILTLSSCTLLMALVAWFSYQWSKDDVASKDGYFLAGRNLGGLFIGGSLLLTNLSAEQ